MRLASFVVVLLMFFCSLAWADETDLVWSTFLGGNERDWGYGIAVNDSGNAYVTGYTYSNDFPKTTGAFDTTLSDNDAFVVKLNAAGSALDYSTFLGGDTTDGAYEIAVDDSGCAYVTGWTTSDNFPTTVGAYDIAFNGKYDVFVTKLNPTGSTLVYSTFLGGNHAEYGRGITIDNSGNAYITGDNLSEDFPTTPGAFDTTYNGSNDVFVVKLNSDGSDLSYSTFLGASSRDRGFSITIDGCGNAYITGETTSPDFPTTPGAFDKSFNSLFYWQLDVFVTQLNPTGSDLIYSTFLGGSDSEVGSGITVDGSGNAYVTGFTGSDDFPTTARAYDMVHNGGDDAYVTKLNPAGSDLVYSTFLGGVSYEWGKDIALDSIGFAYVIGQTRSTDFPTTPWAFDTIYDGTREAFVVKLNSTGSTLYYSTFLGGSNNDAGFGIALHHTGNAFVTGLTGSSDFPTTAGAFDTTYNGSNDQNFDVFVTKLDVSFIDSTPPEPIDDLTAQLHGGFKSWAGNIYLSWSEPYDNIRVSHYVIYRSSEPNMLGDSLDLATDTFYTDMNVSAIGHPYFHVYYSVKAVDWVENISPASNQVGEFDKLLRW